MKPKPLDFAACAAVILTSIACALPIWLAPLGSSLIIEAAGGRETLSLAKNGEHTIVSGGHTIVVRIEDGAARVIASDCSDGLCAASPPVSAPGESIVCVPAGVVLRVSGESEVDGVVG